MVTAESVADISRLNTRPAVYDAVIEKLAELPAGRVFAPPSLGNMVPAYTRHKVWVGHWFLSPDFSDRSETYSEVRELKRDPREVASLLRAEKVDYVVLPTEAADAFQKENVELVVDVHACGTLKIIVLANSETLAATTD